MTATVWGDGTPNEAYEIPPDAIISEQSGNYLITTADAKHVIDYIGTGGDIFTLPATLDAEEGFVIWIRNSGTGALTVLPQGADTVNSAASLPMVANTSVQLMVKGVDFGILASNGLKTQLANTIIFTPAGNIVATDVQAALEELDAEKAALWNMDILLTDTSPSANVITSTAGKTLTAQAETGTVWRLERSSYANTSACTLNIDGQGAVVVTDIDGNPLTAGSIPIGMVCFFYKLAASFVLLNSRNLNAVTATTATVLNSGEVTVTGHATTADIFGAAANSVLFDDAAGAITVTDMPAALKAGMVRDVRYNGATKYVASAGLSIRGVPSGQTITLMAGAEARFRAITTTQFEMTYSYSGSFTAVTSGYATAGAPTPTVYYTVSNGIVRLYIPYGTMQGSGGTGGNTGLSITNLPAYLCPTSQQVSGVLMGNNSGTYISDVTAVYLSGTILAFYILMVNNAWTAASTKGINSTDITYSLY